MADLLENKILVAVDGSQHALDTVYYLGKSLPRLNTHVVLFHVVANLPESFYDFESESAYHYKIINTSAWEAKQRESVQRFMDEARAILIDSGFAPESVSTVVRIRKVGIARDIIEESLNGYCAVVVGRKGLSALKDLVMGSIATKLVGKLAHVPVWIVAGKQQRGKILLCLDSSEGAMLAVDHVARVLGACQDLELTLLHVAADYGAAPRDFLESLGSEFEEEWVKKVEEETRGAESAVGYAMDEARARLIKAGFGPERVIRKIVKGGATMRAATIAEEARQGGFDTIVVGRRGLSKVEEFLMGRVSTKVIDLAKDKTICVVS